MIEDSELASAVYSFHRVRPSEGNKNIVSMLFSSLIKNKAFYVQNYLINYWLLNNNKIMTRIDCDELIYIIHQSYALLKSA